MLAISPELSKTEPEEDDRIVLASVRAGSAHHAGRYDYHYRPRLHIFHHAKSSAPYLRLSAWILPLLRSIDIGEGRNSEELFHGRVVSETVSFPVIQHWLQMCQKYHTASGDTSSSGAVLGQNTGTHLPRRERPSCQPQTKCTIPNFRLIDISKGCVVTADPGDEYAAMSYVWGQAKRLLLSRETCDRLTSPGALSSGKSDVPQTFQDSLLVENRLGISYIRIDALCICEDNEEGLVFHMGLMDSIYSSAVVTIVCDSESTDTEYLVSVGGERWIKLSLNLGQWS